MIKMIYVLLFALLSYVRSGCVPDNSSFVTLNTIYPKISFEKEVIGGVTYGLLISIPNGLWMLSEFSIQSSPLTISKSCPSGWVPPSKSDYQNLLNFANTYNFSILTDPTVFNMNTSRYYGSNTKYNASNYNFSDYAAYQFYGLKFTNKSYASVSTMNSIAYISRTKTFCVYSGRSINNSVSSSSSILNISGLSTRDLIKGIKYTFEVLNTNMLAHQWSINGLVNNSKSIYLIPMKYGKFLINSKATYFDGTVIASCSIIWVRNYTGTEANTSLTPQDIHQVQFTNKPAYRSISLHFTSGSAPIAPIDTGGLYCLYANQTDMRLFVKWLDNEGNQIKEIDLGRSGFPFDIVSVVWGFVFMAIDYNEPNTLYLMGINITDISVVFKRIIMDNGDNPIVYNSDQMIFYKDAAGDPSFGMDAMFDPTNGRLFFAKDRIVCMFAHYNHFGNNSDGSRNDHTGDTLVTFNLTGQDDKLAFSWGSSHSLSQSLVYNGDRAIMSSLGDAYPQNIRFANSDIAVSNSVADPKTLLNNRLDNSANSNLLDGIIPANGQGFSCGRMGTLSVFGDGTFNTISYSRRKCNVTFEGIS